MKPRIAAVIWLVASVFLLAAEFVLLALGEPLLSHAVWELTDRYEVLTRFIVFAIGALFSHFFWYRRK